MKSKEIRKQIRAIRQEMKKRGIKTIGYFNGGLDEGTYRANAALFRLNVELADALKAEQTNAL